MDAWDTLSTSPQLTLAATALGLIIGVISTLITVRARRVRKPRFAISGQNLIKDFSTRLEDLQIIYKGHFISTLTATKVTIWNAGSETIRNEDIASSDPLRVAVAGEGGQILDVEVVQITKQANRFSAQLVQGEAKLQFEYLDKNDGAVVQLLHTCGSPRDVHMLGTVKGAGDPKLPLLLREGPLLPNVLERFFRRETAFFEMMAVLFAALGLGSLFSKDPQRWKSLALSEAVAALLFLMGRFFRSPIPKQLTSSADHAHGG